MEKSKKQTHLNFWANFLLIFGVLGLILFAYLSYQRFNPQKLAFDVDQSTFTQQKNVRTEITQPVGIKIDSIGIALNILPSEIKNNKWESTTTGISYLKSSVFPGEVGNSILYGHNWPNLLGNLTKVKPGDRITIYYADSSSRDFLVEYSAQVKPEDTSILKNSKDRRITLYTCSGFLDSLRFVVVGKLVV